MPCALICQKSCKNLLNSTIGGRQMTKLMITDASVINSDNTLFVSEISIIDYTKLTINYYTDTELKELDFTIDLPALINLNHYINNQLQQYYIRNTK